MQPTRFTLRRRLHRALKARGVGSTLALDAKGSLSVFQVNPSAEVPKAAEVTPVPKISFGAPDRSEMIVEEFEDLPTRSDFNPEPKTEPGIDANLDASATSPNLTYLRGGDTDAASSSQSQGAALPVVPEVRTERVVEVVRKAYIPTWVVVTVSLLGFGAVAMAMRGEA